ncbi:MAG: ParB/RepB/Spo0J family partition protein [Chloroflexota bacterium]
MPRKTGLGRGLDALIPSSETPTPEAGVNEIRIESISPNPRQPRGNFDPGELAELAESIRTHGVIQPLVVTLGDQPGQYVLVAGERRLQAARQAGLESVPVILREASEQQRLELALIENVQRADLSPLEAAEAYRQLSEDFSLSHEQIAERVAKSRVTVTNTLRLLKLPPSVKAALAQGQISEGHARALLALPSPQAQVAALQTILSHDLTVRRTEELVRKLSGERPSAPSRPAPPPEVNDLQTRLESSLGTRVSLNPRGKGGAIVIRYYSNEELEALVERLTGDHP